MPEIHAGLRLKCLAVMCILTFLLVLLVDCVCNARKNRLDISGSLVYLVPVVGIQAIDVSRF